MDETGVLHQLNAGTVSDKVGMTCCTPPRLVSGNNPELRDLPSSFSKEKNVVFLDCHVCAEPGKH